MPDFGDTQFKDIRHMIRHLHQEEQLCQLSRNYLILRVWEELDGLKFTDEQKSKVIEATPTETITRMVRGRWVSL